MTRSERLTKKRVWLKIRKFATTNSLKRTLAETSWLTDKDRECLCYIQNKVLRETRENPSLYANIGAKYWEQKCGWAYRPWIDLLEEWAELDPNKRYRKGTATAKGFTMSYRVPCWALASGVSQVEFRGRATPIQDQTELHDADEIIRYVHECCSRLTVPEALIEIAEPIRDATAHEFSRRVYWGDFNIRYGDTGRRLFHSIIEMPREARANLVFRDEGPSLFDYDIKSCHPVLLLPLFSDPLEREKFSVVLDHDVYSTIRNVMGVPIDRDEIKVQFMVCTNSIDRYVAGKRGVVYQFFKEHFPVFTREVLDIRSDLAAYLQQRESEIMVQELGPFCKERNRFWIPCHDGWMGVGDGEGEIIKKVVEAFFHATGYRVQIKKTGVCNGKFNSDPILFGVSGIYGSYVRIEPTMPPSGYRKSAEEWFVALSKHPEPDAETLRQRQEARENRKQAFRDHKRRGRESDKLRKKARPLWDQLIAEWENRKAA